jgi:hypothetical protein
MTEHATSGEPHDPSQEDECPPVEELLKEVIADLNAFEAKKLAELKTELEAFIKIKESAITDYKNKYDSFLNRWRDEGKQITEIHSDLLCSYSELAWKALIQKGVCSVQAELDNCKKAIKSLKACKGENEKERDEAKDALDAARANLDSWKTAAQKIDQSLNYNQELIKQIQNLNQGEDRPFRLYLLWFKLLPKHNILRPADESPLYPDETPEGLCATSGPSQGSASSAQKAYAHPEKQPPTESPREAPWIVDACNYGTVLDHAFCDYKTAKDKYAEAVAAFQANADDLPAVTKRCDDKTQSFEADVKKKLKDAASQGMTSSKGSER